jgi:tRNA(adenine34) deaminase
VDDQDWMQQALMLARQAADQGEVPVQLLGQGYNQPITANDPSAHAEIIAMRSASLAEKNYRLSGCTLYVTLEPCTMCFGAMVHARIGRLVYGASEPRAGVCESQLQLPSVDFYNHRVEVEKGVLAEESAMLLKRFFADRRKRPR